MEAKKKNKIQYRIVEIKRLSQFENNPKDLGLSLEEIQVGEILLNMSVITNLKNNQVKFDLNVIFFKSADKKKIELFGVRTLHRFEIRDMAKVFPRNANNKLEIPDDFMFTLMRLVIGSVRGILAVSNTNAEYSNIYLPVINIKSLVKSIQIEEE